MRIHITHNNPMLIPQEFIKELVPNTTEDALIILEESIGLEQEAQQQITNLDRVEFLQTQLQLMQEIPLEARVGLMTAIRPAYESVIGESWSIVGNPYVYDDTIETALEGIGNFLRRVWEWIIGFFAKIGNFFKRLFGFGKKAKDEAKKIIVIVDDLPTKFKIVFKDADKGKQFMNIPKAVPILKKFETLSDKFSKEDFIKITLNQLKEYSKQFQDIVQTLKKDVITVTDPSKPMLTNGSKTDLQNAIKVLTACLDAFEKTKTDIQKIIENNEKKYGAAAKKANSILNRIMHNNDELQKQKQAAETIRAAIMKDKELLNILNIQTQYAQFVLVNYNKFVSRVQKV